MLILLLILSHYCSLYFSSATHFVFFFLSMADGLFTTFLHQISECWRQDRAV